MYKGEFPVQKTNDIEPKLQRAPYCNLTKALDNIRSTIDNFILKESFKALKTNFFQIGKRSY